MKTSHASYETDPSLDNWIKGIKGLGEIAMKATGLQLLKEAARHTLQEELPHMSTEQKLGAIGAATLSISRLLYGLAELSEQDQTELSWQKTGVDVVIELSDMFDGLIARGTGGTTKLGGVLDGLVGDKLPRLLKEASMVERGLLSREQFILRVLRDIIVIYCRTCAMEGGHGKVSVDALPKDDPLSGKYSAATLAISNTLLTSPIGEKMPNEVRSLIAGFATVHMLATGVHNIKTYRKQLQKATNRNDNSESEPSCGLALLLGKISILLATCR